MKRLIRKIQMWWWKKHNPEKYCTEYWRDVAKRLTEGCKRATMSMAALAKAMKEYNDITAEEERNLNGNQEDSGHNILD